MEVQLNTLILARIVDEEQLHAPVTSPLLRQWSVEPRPSAVQVLRSEGAEGRGNGVALLVATVTVSDWQIRSSEGCFSPTLQEIKSIIRLVLSIIIIISL